MKVLCRGHVDNLVLSVVEPEHYGEFYTMKQRLQKTQLLVSILDCLSELLSYLVPIPDTTPVVTNNPPTWCVRNPLNISPSANIETPKKAVFLAPSSRITLALTRARNDMQAKVKDPIQERVGGEERPCLKSATCMTPQL